MFFFHTYFLGDSQKNGIAPTETQQISLVDNNMCNSIDADEDMGKWK